MEYESTSQRRARRKRTIGALLIPLAACAPLLRLLGPDYFGIVSELLLDGVVVIAVIAVSTALVVTGVVLCGAVPDPNDELPRAKLRR